MSKLCLDALSRLGLALSHEDRLEPDPDRSDPDDLDEGFRSISLSELLPLLPESVMAEKREEPLRSDAEEVLTAAPAEEDEDVEASAPSAAVK